MQNMMGGLSLLLLACMTGLGQTSNDKPAKTKRVFTNEDLNKFGEKYGTDSSPRQSPAPSAAEAGKHASPAKDVTKQGRSYWAGKLKETDTALEKAKAQELKFHGVLEKYEQKLRDAKTDFHIRTSQEQVADSLKSLARAKDEVKQAEENKLKLLAEAAEKGFKPDDLREETEASGQQK